MKIRILNILLGIFWYLNKYKYLNFSYFKSFFLVHWLEPWQHNDDCLHLSKILEKEPGKGVFFCQWRWKQVHEIGGDKKANENKEDPDE